MVVVLNYRRACCSCDQINEDTKRENASVVVSCRLSSF